MKADRLAAPMIWRQQHDGRHEQDRWDAMAWLVSWAARDRGSGFAYARRNPSGAVDSET